MPKEVEKGRTALYSSFRHARLKNVKSIGKSIEKLRKHETPGCIICKKRRLRHNTVHKLLELSQQSTSSNLTLSHYQNVTPIVNHRVMDNR